MEKIEKIIEKIFIDSLQIKNKNLIEQCNITSKEAKEGTIKKIQIHYKNTCADCKGIKEKCKYCDSKGYIINTKEFILNIPAHTKENDYFEFLEQGNNTNQVQKRGNIYIKIHIYGKKSNRKGRKIYE